GIQRHLGTPVETLTFGYRTRHPLGNPERRKALSIVGAAMHLPAILPEREPPPEALAPDLPAGPGRFFRPLRTRSVLRPGTVQSEPSGHRPLDLFHPLTL